MVNGLNGLFLEFDLVSSRVAAAVAAALFTRRFRFIGLLARVGFRVFAISVHTSAPPELLPYALARAAREVDRVRDFAPPRKQILRMIVTFTGVGRPVRVIRSFGVALGTISI